ncbi:MAG TPA: sulfatase-like hydrolase/transferase [Oscillospiraceae bacterium]|nr:sulfatase-like hydrolase/transferase [Oscillospiraceae bacterium]HPF55701.1 sulfatase-like hydrolase/transferase [Clostridiales bacterium]HPK35554.1 sulfatase-like hydrolase/transferase [Oscillospiraceae bacterium]HPR75916.1 sulfatase-like hydrolase/transferase [Oscillospiraceae bacterium]
MKKPNFLFLFSDQHNPAYLGCQGHPLISTPNLDKLAAEGVLFDQTYCQNPLCVPSRASMMTGLYSKNIGLYENRHIIPHQSQTIARVLTEHGYKTCAIGKTHVNGEQYQGFSQRPYGDLWGQAHQPDPARTPEKGETGLGDIVAESGPSGIPPALTQTEICVSEAARWLQLYKGTDCQNPFFLYVGFDKPHFPINPPRKYYDRYRDRVSLPKQTCDYVREKATPFVREAAEVNGVWEHYGKDEELHLQTLAAYCGCVEWVDDAVGRIVEVLDYLGLGEDTIVIYASDHGEMAYQKGFWQKTVFFEQSAKVPLIFRAPQRFTGARKSEFLTGLVDLMPTICSFAGIKIPESCDGIDLSGYLSDGQTPEREEIFSESVVIDRPEHAGCMLRTGKWKYCYYLDGEQELYDLEKDPDENENLSRSKAHEDLLTEFREKVIAFWEPDKQLDRFKRTPIMPTHKHEYPFSNQFVCADGLIVDGRP